MPSQSLRPSSSYSMDGSEGGRLQQSRVEPAASTNHNGQMLNEKTMQQAAPADDQNLTAISGWQGLFFLLLILNVTNRIN